MSSTRVQHYLGRARDFLKGMENLLNDEVYVLEDDLIQFKYSPALLGIHSAISYCDALRSGLGSKSLSSEDHKTALKDLKTLLTSRKYEEQQGSGRLEILLADKNLIAYSEDRATEKEIRSIVQQAERFALWAERTARRLKIEGWGDD